MRLPLNASLLVASLAGLSAAQNCPYLGPAYPPATGADAPAFVSASAALDKALADAIGSGKIAGTTTNFAIQVYSTSYKKPIYASYHTPTISNGTRATAVGPDTVFRAYSISKLITVYAILIKLGDKYWDEPVAKYVPEISHLSGGNPAYDADWEEITLGSLASLMSGIGRDYALGDFSVTGAKSNLSGFRDLIDFEAVKCGAEGQKACTRAEAIQAMLSVYPFSSAFNTPNYSNMAFQLLAYAVENITGTPFPDLVKRQLIEPLNLRHTFLTTPSNITTDVAIADGWDQDFGDESPSAGYYLSANDLSTLGSSILSSTLLPAKLTRKWLKPLTHTSSLLTSLGRPWEIIRSRVPVSASSKATRIIDVYTKQGGGGTYTSLIALSPAHNLGISILTAGPSSGSNFKAIKSLALDTFLAAAELAAREEAKKNYAARYILNANSTVEIVLQPEEPGLFVNKFTSQGTDMLSLFGSIANLPAQAKLGAWLYPMGLQGRAFSGTEVAFRAAVGAIGVPAAEDCASWAEVDRLRYGRYPGDLALFGVGGGGQVSSVNFPMVNERSYRKEGTQGDTIFGPFEPGE